MTRISHTSVCANTCSNHVYVTLKKLKQGNDPLHHLYEQDLARKRLKSRHSFLHSVEPLDGSARTRRLNLWSSHLQTTPHKLLFSPKESLPPGSSEAWPTWSSLNRLRTGTGRCKSLIQKWGFKEDGRTTCECGDEQTMKHPLVCPILPQPCTHEDLEEFNPELDPAPSIGRESSSDSRRRKSVCNYT